MIKYLFASFLCLFTMHCRSQEDLLACPDSGYCEPSITGALPAKWIELKHERVFDYSMRASAEGTNESAFVDFNRRWVAKLKFPIVLRDGLTLAGGLSYAVETYKFQSPEELDFPFFQNLERKPLNAIGVALYGVKPFRGDNYLLLRGGFSMNGDFSGSPGGNGDFAKISAAVMYGIKRNPSTAIAFGLAYSYTFGQALVYPILSYNKALNMKWSVQSLLPVNAKVRFSPSKNTNWWAKAELHGGNFNLHFDGSDFSDNETLYLEKSELRWLLSYERRIHDWLWCGFELGARTNINFSLDDEYVQFGGSPLINNSLTTAAVFGATLFAVPPEKMLRKHKQ